MRSAVSIIRGAVLGALLLAGTSAVAQEPGQDQGALAKALAANHISLSAGLASAGARGRPISAKYELEDGKLQLSVYTEKGGDFSEVIVDHHSGKVAKAEKISEGDDLKDAKAQSEAMAKARRSLAAALRKALAANKGYSAVSATATLKDGKPAAEITLYKGSEFKTVTEPLA